MAEEASETEELEELGILPGESRSVKLLDCKPGEGVAMSSIPSWFEKAFTQGRIERTTGIDVDGVEKTYLYVVKLPNDTNRWVVRTGDFIDLGDDNNMLIARPYVEAVTDETL